jgi:hypothetical protein
MVEDSGARRRRVEERTACTAISLACIDKVLARQYHYDDENERGANIKKRCGDGDDEMVLTGDRYPVHRRFPVSTPGWPLLLAEYRKNRCSST